MHDSTDVSGVLADSLILETKTVSKRVVVTFNLQLAIITCY